MKMNSLTALLSCCLYLAFSVGQALGEKEDKAQMHLRGPQHVPKSCELPEMGLSAFGYPGPQKQLELKLEFQPRTPQMLRSSGDDAERLLRYGSNALSCPAAQGFKESSRELPAQEQAPAELLSSEDDYDDNDDASDEDNSDSDDVNDNDADDDDLDNDKDFTARVSCLLRKLYQNTKYLSDDLKVLDSTLLPQISSAPRKSSYQSKSKGGKKSSLKQRPKNAIHGMVKHDDYSDLDPISDRFRLKSKRVSGQKLGHGEQKLKTQPISAAKDPVKQSTEERLLQSQPGPIEAAIKYVQVPLVVPSTRIIVPPLLQLLTRRSALPWSIRGPSLIQSRRYLHALNEMRLSRAVQAVAANRIRQQKGNRDLQHHVEEFKENLRRLVSNRAAIERRVSGLLTGISHDVKA